MTRGVGGAPFVLRVVGPDDVLFTADLVPAFEFELHHLKTCCHDLHERVQGVFKDKGITSVKNFLMVALKGADKDNFEINFHQTEKEILSKTGGCVKKVIMLMKYLRDSKGGSVTHLWSHLLKVKS